MGVDFSIDHSMSYLRYNTMVGLIMKYYDAVDNPCPEPCREIIIKGICLDCDHHDKCKLEGQGCMRCYNLDGSLRKDLVYFPYVLPGAPRILQRFVNYPYQEVSYDNGDLEDLYVALTALDFVRRFGREDVQDTLQEFREIIREHIDFQEELHIY